MEQKVTPLLQKLYLHVSVLQRSYTYYIIFTALQVCSRGIAMSQMSVRPSVCPSDNVQTREL